MCTSGPHTSGHVGLRLCLDLLDQLADLLRRVVVPAPAEVEVHRVGGDTDVPGRLDRRQELQRGLADLPAQPVAALVAVRARLVVAEPPVERGEIACAALEEDALDARVRGLEDVPNRRDVLGVPHDGRAAHRDRVRSGTDEGRQRPAGRVVDADEREGVVDGSFVLHAVAAKTRASRRSRSRSLPAPAGATPHRRLR